jgi:N-acetylglutamate synthase-like GNAT family acetyltransferase
MTVLHIRPAVADDSSAIKALVRTARINPTGLKWPRFLVVEHNPGEVVACAQIKPHRDGSHELASLVVDSAFRGQGVARSLVEHLTANHEGELYLMCRSSLGDFYEKLGFEVIAEPQMPPYFRKISRLASLAEFLQKEGETLFVMRKI